MEELVDDLLSAVDPEVALDGSGFETGGTHRGLVSGQPLGPGFDVGTTGDGGDRAVTLFEEQLGGGARAWSDSSSANISSTSRWSCSRIATTSRC